MACLDPKGIGARLGRNNGCGKVRIRQMLHLCPMIAAIDGSGFVSRIQPGNRPDAGHCLVVKGYWYAQIHLENYTKGLPVLLCRQALHLQVGRAPII
jgi:hypothetical protein